jgi:hypothetical protein
MKSTLQFVTRFCFFIRRYGIPATFSRITLELRRLRKGSRMVLFYFDLSEMDDGSTLQVANSCIERKRDLSQLDADDCSQILNSGNPLVIKFLIEKRFVQGASLWLFKDHGKIAGFGWTLVGRNMEPHFFPLTPVDIHFFDFFVFPEHRGRRINPSLVNGILKQLSHESRGRAYIECAEWNESQLASLKYTPFQTFGIASKHTRSGKTVVVWS